MKLPIACLALLVLGCSGETETANVQATISEARAHVPPGIPLGPPSGVDHPAQNLLRPSPKKK